MPDLLTATHSNETLIPVGFHSLLIQSTRLADQCDRRSSRGRARVSNGEPQNIESDLHVGQDYDTRQPELFNAEVVFKVSCWRRP